jgi:hypothetical protein
MIVAMLGCFAAVKNGYLHGPTLYLSHCDMDQGLLFEAQAVGKRQIQLDEEEETAIASRFLN